jgi:hypothetical protein
MKKIIIIVIFALISACAGSNKDSNDPNLSAKMNKAARSLQDLIPYLYSRDQFHDKKNRGLIKSKLTEFKGSIHQINPDLAKNQLGDDPYIIHSLTNLNELTDRSLESFERGDLRNSRILLKATTNTCFKCHTRQTMGPQTASWDNFDIEKINTDSIEKAHLLIAMRQYEEAKLYLSNFLREMEQKTNFDTTYETALHYYLMISLRGQQTFDTSLNFIKAKLLLPGVPTELKFTLKHWEKDLLHWKKHGPRLQPTLKHARGVLQRNGKRYSQRNLINNLVSSSLLHQFLMTNPSQVEKARAFSTLGYIYDELIVEGFWDLPETYYEVCIRYAPNTPVAKTCFKQIHKNITLGYSGSRGTLIPDQEYARLEELRKLAGL